jgi:hypothetical protein
MDCKRVRPAFSATALVVALFAITLNFLQPLAHAAALRDGDPQKLWAAFCKPSMQQEDGKASHVASQSECCLGLAHAASLIAPSSSFLLVESVAVALPVSSPADDRPAAAIRDGPTRPRGPPISV